MRSGIALMFASLAVASCASTSSETLTHPADDTADTPSANCETCPPREAARPAQGPPRVASAAVTIEPKDGAWRLDELFEFVQAATGVSLLYDSDNPTFKQARVYICGRFQLAEDELFAWLQAVLSYRKLVVVPLGPRGADGKQQWLVMDTATPPVARPAPAATPAPAAK